MVGKLLALDFLKNYRTKIIAVIMASLTFSLNIGWIDIKTYTEIVGFLTAVGLITSSVHQPKG